MVPKKACVLESFILVNRGPLLKRSKEQNRLLQPPFVIIFALSEVDRSTPSLILIKMKKYTYILLYSALSKAI